MWQGVIFVKGTSRMASPSPSPAPHAYRAWDWLTLFGLGLVYLITWPLGGAPLLWLPLVGFAVWRDPHGALALRGLIPAPWLAGPRRWPTATATPRPKYPPIDNNPYDYNYSCCHLIYSPAYDICDYLCCCHLQTMQNLQNLQCLCK